MCCGWSPFYAEDTQQMYKNICFGKIRFPKGVINEDGKQFVKGVSFTPTTICLGLPHIRTMNCQTGITDRAFFDWHR